MSDSASSRAPENAGDVSIAEQVWQRSSAGLCLVNARGRVIRSNRAFADVVGYSMAELVDLPLIRLHPGEQAMAMQALHQAVIAGDESTDGAANETLFINRRGRPIAAYVRNSRLEQVDGEVLRLITLVDLTDAARSDQNLEQVSRMATYTALSSTVSNDLNNLLSIILGYTALLQEGNTDSRRQKVVAEGVDGAVQRATLLIKQSLYMMRRPDPVRQKADLGKFLENKLQLLRAEIGDRPIELELSLVAELKQVPLDAMQLGDAVGEMVRRLHAFDPDSARGLRTRTRWEAGSETRLRHAQADARTYAVIEIINPGRPRTSSRPPMPQEEPVDESPRHDLGLTMVERIIEAHQGFVEHKSEAGGAASCTVWLPLGITVELEDSGMEPPSLNRAEGVGPQTVLLVDDEEGLLQTMASALRAQNFEVITALDGESALLQFRQHAKQLDVVVTDLVLPGMSGWEVFTAIRDANPDLPVLIMSGHLEPKLEAAVHRSGAAGFVQKPFGMTMFLRRVRGLLGQT